MTEINGVKAVTKAVLPALGIFETVIDCKYGEIYENSSNSYGVVVKNWRKAKEVNALVQQYKKNTVFQIGDEVMFNVPAHEFRRVVSIMEVK